MVAPVSLFIVHRNQPERCLRTLETFAGQGIDLSITLLDNDSEPENLATIERAHPELVVVPTGGNLGFGPAANVGLRAWLTGELGAAGEYVAVAPHDALPEAGCLAKVIAELDARPAAGLASAEYGTDEVPEMDRNFGGITRPATRGEGWEPAAYPHGTLLVARRACLEEIGLFDERFFAYCEEADLGARARAAGWEVGIVWGAIVVNPHMSGAAPALDYLMLRNSLLLVRQHSGRFAASVQFVIAIAMTLWLGARPSRRPEIFSVSARWRALRDFLRQRSGPPPSALFEERATRRDNRSTTAA